MTTAKRFEFKLRTLLTDVFGSCLPRHGFREQDILTCEQRLQSKLPGVLASCYLTAGRHRAFDGALVLVAPEKLEFLSQRADDPFFQHDNDGLVFMVEEQAVCFNLIEHGSLKEEDPAVYQGSDFDHHLEVQSSSLASFLLRAIIWNAIQSSKVVVKYKIDRSKLERLKAFLTQVHMNDDAPAFYKGTLLAFAFPRKNERKQVIGYMRLQGDEAKYQKETKEKCRSEFVMYCEQNDLMLSELFLEFGYDDPLEKRPHNCLFAITVRQ